MRLSTFKEVAPILNEQSTKEFDLFISNSGPYFNEIEEIVKKELVNISYTLLDSDNSSIWRRHILAKKLAKAGYKKIMFLDDDILIPKNYVEMALSQYEDLSYKSWWAWDLNGGNNYEKDRSRVLDPNTPSNYCGAGVSIIDAKVFLEDGYFSNPDLEHRYIDDIWISMYTGHIMGWNLRYLDINGVSFSGEAGDVNALYINIKNKNTPSKTKDEYVRDLKERYGWMA